MSSLPKEYYKGQFHANRELASNGLFRPNTQDYSIIYMYSGGKTAGDSNSTIMQNLYISYRRAFEALSRIRFDSRRQ